MPHPTNPLPVFAASLALILITSPVQSQGPAPADATKPGPEFAVPVRLTVNSEWIQVESPGYASPAWHDVDGDGRGDLIVGQFHDGKMKVYRNLGEGRFAAGEWLLVDDEVAQVPGVW